MPSSARPYRLQKRQKPCDRCRERKLRCQTEGDHSCQRCEREHIPCTYQGQPRRRALGRQVVGHDQPMSDGANTPMDYPAEVDDSSILQNPDTSAHTSVHGTPTINLAQGNDSHGSLPPSFGGSAGSVHQQPTQLSQSLDQIEGHTAQLFGGSSESDPWLLRHCRFDEFGLRTFHKVHFRNPGGVPTKEKIPVHFMISADELAKSAALETRVSQGIDPRSELDLLVPPECGVRLVRLFHRYIFPVLPIISRTQLGLTGVEDVPSLLALGTIPVHLLAAIYASALPYSMEDEQLAPLNAYQKPPLNKIWRIVYKILQEEIHRPRLSALQAAVLYLHKGVEDEHQLASSATPFLWSFMGSVIGLAHTLGLHLECLMFGIPAHEKRLRRRLWWAIYVEDKMLSLLMGRPPYIHETEWDVSELRNQDFDLMPGSYTSGSITQTCAPFQDMTRLALIANSIQESLYSLRSCQRLAEDLPASIAAAKPLFDQLNTWRASISVHESFPSAQNMAFSEPERYPKAIYFAYLTLVVYVWRALLRPTVRSLPPPQIIDVDQPIQPIPDTAFFFDDFSWDMSDLPEIELNIDEDITDTSATVKELHQAAQSCAGNLVAFTRQLRSSDFGEFWYSWSRVSFAVVSNFLLALLVQAPSGENAIKARQMMEAWRQVLRDQSRAFPMLLLAMTRLNSFYWAGLQETFCLPPHVEEIFH